MTSLLANTNIMRKVLAVLLLLGAVTLGLFVVNASRIGAVDSNYSGLVNGKLSATTQLVRLNRFATEMVQIGYRTIAFAPGSALAQSASADIGAKHEQARKALSEAVELDPALNERSSEILSTVGRIHDLAAEGARLARAGDTAAGASKFGEADRLVTAWGTDMVALNSERLKEAQALSADLTASTGNTMTMSLVTSVIAILLGVATAFWVVRAGITAPIATLEQRMRRLADGDTATAVEGADRKDEVGAMARALQTCKEAAIERERLSKAKAKADAEQQEVVRVLGEQLAAVAQGDLTAEITQPFPAEYETLKGSMNQADRTVARADQTISTVSGGRGVADEAIQAMGRISESAKGIDSVIEGLDKIAFQTRVLAMNAAVEAGRAGEAGRGFAVVADLVSALAMRAEEEAKRARGQLTLTQADIGTAVEAVQRVDGALANISGDVGEVHDLLRVMATDNQAQSRAISEINAAVSSMDQATQQSAAMVEQTSAAARSLLGEVQALTQHASEFKVDRRKEQAPRHLWPEGERKASASVHVLPAAASTVTASAHQEFNPVHQLQRKAVAAGGRARADDDWTES